MKHAQRKIVPTVADIIAAAALIEFSLELVLGLDWQIEVQHFQLVLMSKDEKNLNEEKKDLKLRDELQSQLQSAIRRSASKTEINRIQKDIEKLNEKLSQRPNWTK